jgi:ABC-type lipoprotein release transport system permease subunit
MHRLAIGRVTLASDLPNSQLDTQTYVAVVVRLVIAATVASYVPARHASAFQPVEALAAIDGSAQE